MTNRQSAVLGGGCFWCLEAIYQRVKGVEQVISGYAGGQLNNPSYEDLHAKDTGHAEVVKIEFDPDVITYEKILEIFWHIHDPTTPNRQGNDVGPEYRSIILYNGDSQHNSAEKSLKEVGQPLWDDPLVTELKPLDVFYPAEDYHQDYFNKNPQNAYCQVIINPKLAKFQKNFAQLLKS
ncbi:MAG TPA: peptide-methionine (S)-S-oxide reductase MsrA [Candidatus Saccharimonadales bacterium]